jgi:hypothetical protein
MEQPPIINSEQYPDRGMFRNYHASGIGFGFRAHQHLFDHTITCTKGSIKLVVDNVETIITPTSDTFTFPKGSLHSVEIAEDGTEFYVEHPETQQMIETTPQ